MQNKHQSLETWLADNQRKTRYFQQRIRLNLPYDKQLAVGLLFNLRAYKVLQIHQGLLSTYFNGYIYYRLLKLMDQVEEEREAYYFNSFRK